MGALVGKLPEPRLQYSIEIDAYRNYQGNEKQDSIAGLVFDTQRGTLLIANPYSGRIEAYSSADGSKLSSFVSSGVITCSDSIVGMAGIAISEEHDRVFVASPFGSRLHVWCLSTETHAAYVGGYKKRGPALREPTMLAVDSIHDRVLVSDAHTGVISGLSLVDFSVQLRIGDKRGSGPGEFRIPGGVAVDEERGRIIAVDSANHRVQVFSSSDGSFLFAFDIISELRPGYQKSIGICVVNGGRIVVAVHGISICLDAYTSEGKWITSYPRDTDSKVHVRGVAFDRERGLIAFGSGKYVHVIGANQWLWRTFEWTPARSAFAPPEIRCVVETLTMIRSLEHGSVVSLLPNELLFEIFALL